MTGLFAETDHVWDLLDIPGRSNDPAALAELYIGRSIWAWRRYGVGMWGFRPRDGSGPLIGYSGFVIDEGQELDPARELEAGWGVGLDHAGCGFALEASAAALDEAFARLGTARVTAITSPDNHPSRRLMERLGMVRGPDVTAYQGRQVFYAVDASAWRSRADG